MSRLLRVLQFLRITDDCHQVSLTNLAVYLGFYCMCRGVQVNWTAIGAFFIGMCGYHARQALQDEKPSEEAAQRITDLEAKVNKMASPERLAQLAESLRQRGPGAR